MNGRDKLPDWERLWFDLVLEEFRRNTRDGSSSKNDDEENCALDGKEKKGKRRKSHSKSETEKEGKKCDISKIKIFHCHDHGHYATNCPQKKNNNNKATGAAAGKALASQFELQRTSHAWRQL